MKTHILFGSRSPLAAAAVTLLAMPCLGLAQVAPAPGGGSGGARSGASSGGSSSSSSSGTSGGSSRSITSGAGRSSTSGAGSSTTSGNVSRSRTTTNLNNLGAQPGSQPQQQQTQPSTSTGVDQGQPGGGQNLNQGQLRGGTQQPATAQGQGTRQQPSTTTQGQTSTSTQRSDAVNQNRTPLPPRNSTTNPKVNAPGATTGTTTGTNATTGATTTGQPTASQEGRTPGSAAGQNQATISGQAALTAQQNAAGFGTALQGTISNLGDTGFTFAGGTNTAPQTFLTTPDTVYVDSDNRTVTRDKFPTTQPATVYYTQSPNGLVATRIVARPKTGDFSTGTLTEVSPGVMVMTLPNSSDTPVRYVNDKTTNYVDQNGEPVSPDIVKAGTPVKVFYTKVGDTLYASKVEVQTGASGLPRPPVTEDAPATTTKPRDPNANR